MTNMMRYRSPFEQPWWSAEEVYRYLRSWWRDDTPVTFGGDGRTYSDIPSPFMFTGRPPGFWSEENIEGAGTRNVPGDRRFIWSTGPFRVDDGESAEILIAMVWAQGQDRFDSVYKLLDAIPIVKETSRDGLPPFFLPPPSAKPELRSPDAGVPDQPSRPTLRWQDVALADGYEIEIRHADTVVAAEHIRTRPFPTSVTAGTASFVAELERSQTYSWRVRPSNAGGFGPWSVIRSFTTGSVDLSGPGPHRIGPGEEEWAFIQVQGIGDDDACGPDAGSRFGCDEVGGNFVYGSWNGQGDWVMYHVGSGPEASIGAFAPNDFEIRVTEDGSYGYYGFTSGNLVPVPFETWDIGPTGPFGVNDTTDDIQMAHYLFADAGGECSFGFGEGEDPFGLGWQITDRIYAYYTDPDYDSWEAAARAVVDAHPARCPSSPHTDAVDSFVDRNRGRPLQRIVFMMEPYDPDYRPEMIPVGNVIRFLTTKPVPPLPSAPASGTIVSSEVTLYWQLPPNADTSRVQIATASDFESIKLDRIVRGDHFEARGLEAGTYHWRVSYGGEDWSESWRFVVVPGTSSEDDGLGLPTELELKPTYPNPSSGPRTLVFGVPQTQRVSLEVFDLLGRRVESISDGERTAGWHSERWDPKGLSAGVYFVVLESGTDRDVKSVVLAR